MKRFLARTYYRLISALAVIAGIIMAAIFVGVIADVTIRNLGYQSPAAIEPLCEYGLLYITMLGSPWLLHNKGMIIVESLRLIMPGKVQRALEIMVYSVAALISATLAWYALYQTWFSWAFNEGDQRAITVPLSYAYAPMAFGFFLMACEFLRLLFGRETLYGQSVVEREVV
jgi:TRAP-type C4-dicarboxylate transport system permease small subunit